MVQVAMLGILGHPPTRHRFARLPGHEGAAHHAFSPTTCPSANAGTQLHSGESSGCSACSATRRWPSTVPGATAVTGHAWEWLTATVIELTGDIWTP
jgi:hypothetical protein